MTKQEDLEELKKQLAEREARLASYQQYDQLPSSSDDQFDPRRLYINSDAFPDAAASQYMLRMEGAEKILKDITRYLSSGVFTETTANVLTSLVNPLIAQDFALGSYEGHKPVELKAMYDIDTIIACRGVPREDRDQIEFINIVNMIKFQYGIEATRGSPDSSGLNERSRQHIRIGESRHILKGDTPSKRRRGFSPLSVLMNRGATSEQGE